MDLIIILFWFAVSVAILIGIISSSYYVHVRGVDDLTLVSKIVFALIVYGLLAFGTGSLAGFVVYVGAQTVPRGSVLGTKEFLIGGAIVLIYAAIGWLVCSFIAGKLILTRRTGNDQ